MFGHDDYNPPAEPFLDILYEDPAIMVLNKPSGILTVPGKRLEEFFDSLNLGSPFGGFSDAMLDCELDFPRPPFYNKLFELWGLEQGEDWKLG